MAANSVTPRFVVAKYAPDLERMEPRNIGVFLWARGELCAQFLEPNVAASFVSELDVYERWVRHWTNLIAKDAVAPQRGRPVPKSDPNCLDALLSTQKGNYILTDAGELMQPIRKKQLTDATSFLFKELIAISPTKDAVQHGFSQKCLDVLKESGIAQQEGFRTKFPVECQIFGSQEKVHFSYGQGNGTPNILLQRVQLGSEQSIESAALKLHSIVFGAVLPKKACRVLIRKSDMTTPTASQGYKLLNRLCGIVDVESQESREDLADLLQLTA